MNNCKFSFIVPVYNAEKTLTRCIDSMIQQKIYSDEFEIILVNDGSKDNSLEICNEYADRYKNICVISQSNSGVSSARNAGIRMAKGEWLVFVDADDWISENVLQVLDSQEMSNADVVFFDYKAVVSHQNFVEVEQCSSEGQLLSLEQVILATLDYQKIPRVNARFNSPWGKCFRRELVVSNDIQFDTDIKIAEDFVFDLQVYSLTERFLYIPVLGYFYFYNEESATRKFQKDVIENNQKVETRFMQIKLNFEMYPWFENAYVYSVNKGLLNCLFLELFNQENTLSIVDKKKILLKLLDTEPYKTAAFKYKCVCTHFNVKHRIILFLAFRRHVLLLDRVMKLNARRK